VWLFRHKKKMHFKFNVQFSVPALSSLIFHFRGGQSFLKDWLTNYNVSVFAQNMVWHLRHIWRFWHSQYRTSLYILIIKANEMHYFSNLFDKVLYVFRTIPLFIIGSISTLYTRNRYLSYANRTSMTNTYCVYTVLRYSRWWTVDLSETRRVLYQINLRNSASSWLLL
jgi:hypothetical protein